MKTVLITVVMMCVPLVYSQQKPTQRAGVLATHQCENVADDRALRQIADDWKDGYNAGDSAGVAALYSEDAYYLTQHFVTGIVHGRDQIQAYVKKGTDARYHVDKIEVIETACAGDFALRIDQRGREGVRREPAGGEEDQGQVVHRGPRGGSAGCDDGNSESGAGHELS